MTVRMGSCFSSYEQHHIRTSGGQKIKTSTGAEGPQKAKGAQEESGRATARTERKLVSLGFRERLEQKLVLKFIGLSFKRPAVCTHCNKNAER